MYKLIALALIISQVYTVTPTCTSTQISYNSVCIEKSCLNSKLAQFQLLSLNGAVTEPGTLSTGLTYSIASSSDVNGQFYIVSINYPDTATTQILGDLVNCINYQVYSTVNAYSISPTRQFLVSTTPTDGQIATWPLTTYAFDATVGASLTFNIRQPDMQKNCIKLAGIGNIEYDCFFELAFQVAGITQVSYYFSIRALINTAITSAALPPADFVKLIQVDSCSATTTGQCLVKVTINSALQFCDTPLCVKTSSNPFFTLFLNRQFFMKHSIIDAAFQTWYILNPSVSFQSQLLKETLASTEFSVTFNAGFNIYGLKVPIVTPQCMISASGTLALTAIGRRFLQNSSNQTNSSSKNVVFDSKYTGNISANSTSSSNAQILVSLLFIGLVLIV